MRCPWCLDGGPLYLSYHNEEWGVGVDDERGLFERLSLEAFQAGLSWITILRKRESFRRAFADFDPDAVAAFGENDRRRLLDDASIVRNRAKIDATIANAQAIIDLRAAGGIAALIESHRPPPGPAPMRLGDVPATTPAARELARDLRAHGLRFVGPTTAYATMQALGLVDDHLVGCFRRDHAGASTGR